MWFDMVIQKIQDLPNPPLQKLSQNKQGTFPLRVPIKTPPEIPCWKSIWQCLALLKKPRITKTKTKRKPRPQVSYLLKTWRSRQVMVQFPKTKTNRKKTEISSASPTSWLCTIVSWGVNKSRGRRKGSSLDQKTPLKRAPSDPEKIC